MEASLKSRVYNHEQGVNGRPVGLSLLFSLGEPLLGPWFPFCIVNLLDRISIIRASAQLGRLQLCGYKCLILKAPSSQLLTFHCRALEVWDSLYLACAGAAYWGSGCGKQNSLS